MQTTIEWLGCATFRLTIGETVVFLDAYMDRAEDETPVGLLPEEVERADYVLVGHSHGDHLWGAERIARNTGATIIGSHETVRIMSDEEEIPEGQLMVVGGGERIWLSDDATVRVFPSLHSCTWSDNYHPMPGEACTGDLGVTYHERQAMMRARRERQAGEQSEARSAFRARQKQRPRTEGGAWSYLIETSEGSVYWADSMGYWSGLLLDLHPDVAVVAAAGRGNVDGEPTQGSVAEFVAREAELMHPARLMIGHHDSEHRDPALAEDAVQGALGRVFPRVEFRASSYLEPVSLFDGLVR